MQKILISTIVGLTLAFTIGGVATAVETIPSPFGPIPTGATTGGEFIEILVGITDWIFVFLLILAVLFIVLAAFQFVTAGGDPAAVGQARNKLIYAAVGVIVAALSKGLPIAIRSIVGT